MYIRTIDLTYISECFYKQKLATCLRLLLVNIDVHGSWNLQMSGEI